jgi:hypothetical protein
MKVMRDKRMEGNMNDDRKDTTACQDAKEASLKKMEPNSGGKEAVVERQEIRN